MKLQNRDGGVGLRLKEARLALGLSQQAWADLLGEKRQRVIDIERERSSASPEMLVAATTRAKLSSEWLATGVGEMFVPASGPGTGAAERAAAILRAATLDTMALDLPDEVRRLAQEWVVAVRLRNVEAVRRLASYGAKGAEERRSDVDPVALARAMILVEELAREASVDLSLERRARLVAAVYALGPAASREAVRQIVAVIAA